MQIWEYLEVGVAFDRRTDLYAWSDSLGREGTLTKFGGRVESVNSAPLLSELGMEGWELVGVVSSAATGFHKLILKRPRE